MQGDILAECNCSGELWEISFAHTHRPLCVPNLLDKTSNGSRETNLLEETGTAVGVHPIKCFLIIETEQKTIFADESILQNGGRFFCSKALVYATNEGW